MLMKYVILYLPELTFNPWDKYVLKNMFKNNRSRIICIIEIECVEISLEKIKLR